MKRVLMFGDTHCGHQYGLVPPEFEAPPGCATPTIKLPHNDLQAEMWKRWLGLVERHRGADVGLFLGDAIDGKGEASGGTELWSADRHIQAYAAAHCLAMMECREYKLVFGTPYHTGREEDGEVIVAQRLRELGFNVTIHHQIYVQVEGITFHLQHHIGGSSRPHTKHTASAGAALNLAMWAALGREQEDWPRADIVVRGHRHQTSRCETPELGEAIVLPALQAARTKHGALKYTNPVHWGVWTCIVDGSRYNLDDPGRDIVMLRASRPIVEVVGNGH